MQVKFDMRHVLDGLEAEGKDAEKVVKRTVNDMRSRAPGWISKNYARH